MQNIDKCRTLIGASGLNFFFPHHPFVHSLFIMCIYIVELKKKRKLKNSNQSNHWRNTIFIFSVWNFIVIYIFFLFALFVLLYIFSMIFSCHWAMRKESCALPWRDTPWGKSLSSWHEPWRARLVDHHEATGRARDSLCIQNANNKKLNTIKDSEYERKNQSNSDGKYV